MAASHFGPYLRPTVAVCNDAIMIRCRPPPCSIDLGPSPPRRKLSSTLACDSTERCQRDAQRTEKRLILVRLAHLDRLVQSLRLAVRQLVAAKTPGTGTCAGQGSKAASALCLTHVGPTEHVAVPSPCDLRSPTSPSAIASTALIMAWRGLSRRAPTFTTKRRSLFRSSAMAFDSLKPGGPKGDGRIRPPFKKQIRARESLQAEALAQKAPSCQAS